VAATGNTRQWRFHAPATFVVALELVAARLLGAVEFSQVVEAAALLAEALGAAVNWQAGQVAVGCTDSVPLVVCLAIDQFDLASSNLRVQCMSQGVNPHTLSPAAPTLAAAAT
jgi:hypothetical protein